MNVCPYCSAKANPLRLIAMTRRAPYRCGQCGGQSLLRPVDNTVAAIMTIIVVAVCAVALPWIGMARALVCFLGLYILAVGGFMGVFMRLQPIRKP